MPQQINRRICLMGYRAVGKTSLAIQFVDNNFADTYTPTIENNFTKVINYKGMEYITEIIDTATQDEIALLQKHYSLGIHGYILVYSVTSKKSLQMTRVINDKILNALGAPKCPRVMVGNKIDLTAQRKVSRAEAEAIAKECGCVYLECSAKQDAHIDAVFDTIIAEIDKDTDSVGVTSPLGRNTFGCIIL